LCTYTPHVIASHN